MELITLPGTELKVSPVCLGTWQFNNGITNNTWDAQTEEVSDAFVCCRSLLINFIIALLCPMLLLFKFFSLFHVVATLAPDWPLSKAIKTKPMNLH